VVKKLITHPVFLVSEHIACYWACQNEMNTGPLIEAIWQANKICYLPILRTDGLLHFVRYNENDSLKKNKFAIPEPNNVSRLINPLNLELIITPLVAFDLQGHRLGMGGGYYDRTLAFKQEMPHSKPIILGLGYAAQEAPLLPADPWDIILDMILSEQTIKIIGSS
jgi:5-formyltetrahydrofolate cyclo-ligase